MTEDTKPTDTRTQHDYMIKKLYGERGPVHALTDTAFGELSDQERQLWRFETMQTSDIKDRDNLRLRLSAFIHVRCVDNTPVKLATLSRRFNKTAAKLSTTVMGEIHEMVLTGQLSLIGHNTNVIVTTKMWDRRKADWEALGFSAKEKIESEVTFLSNAQ